MSDEKTVVKGVRTAPTNWDDWSKAAESEGKSRNSWIEELLNRAAKRILRKGK